MITVLAPAKINLFLHVGPVRADGYHELESLFVFADVGDAIVAAPSEELSLLIDGPFSDALNGLPPEKNLVWRAAEALRQVADVKDGAALKLEKRLPVAAGIGGGSADAAAALHALVSLWNLDIPESTLAAVAFQLGADIPACLQSRPAYVGGAGEIIEPGPQLPPLWVALVNPRVAMPTGAVFNAFDKAIQSPPPLRRSRIDEVQDYPSLKSYLSEMRNDLEPFAVEREPVIGSVIEMLHECPGALIARMSGSGATCFGLFDREEQAEQAALLARKKDWWALSGSLVGHGSIGL